MSLLNIHRCLITKFVNDISFPSISRRSLHGTLFRYSKIAVWLGIPLFPEYSIVYSFSLFFVNCFFLLGWKVEDFMRHVECNSQKCSVTSRKRSDEKLIQTRSGRYEELINVLVAGILKIDRRRERASAARIRVGPCTITRQSLHVNFAKLWSKIMGWIPREETIYRFDVSLQHTISGTCSAACSRTICQE